MRIVGMDIHRSFAQVAILEEGKINKQLRVELIQQPPSLISIIPAHVRCAGGENDAGCGAHVVTGAGAAAISTGTKVGTASPPSRPWRACRRQVNSRL